MHEQTNDRVLSVNQYARNSFVTIWNKRNHRTSRVSRRQFENVTTLSKMSKMWNLVTIFWNHHENCIQISTNTPGIGSLIREIHVKITEI